MKRLLILSLVVVLSACTSLGDRGAMSQEQLAAQEAARQEAERQEAARQEAERQEAARQEAARQEEARQEAARQEEARLEEERRREEERVAEEERRWEELRKEEEARREEERLQQEARKQEELRQIEALRKQRMEDDDDVSLVGMVTEEQLRKANPLLLEQSIFFDFDRYQIKAEYAPIIAAHARFLIAHPTVKIFVEGNCDDRGSPEYNISLGQRRADAVQRALLALGVPKRQVEAVSFGAERPIAYGANEVSWARNRRSDIAYPMLKN
jgi:peptidoglycan-associated lipoprotein